MKGRLFLGLVLLPQLALGFEAAPAAPELLTQWRQVRAAAEAQAPQPERERETAMVLAWGQVLENTLDEADSALAEFALARVDSTGYVRRQLSAALADLEAAGDSYAARRGSFFSAYRSSLDGSGQLYLLHVPAAYDPARAWALVVKPAPYLEFTPPEPLDPGPDHLVLWCAARGQNGIEGLAELDAFEAIDDVLRHYRIDPDRVYLQGSSIGGGGVWRLASLAPHRFAGAIVDYGWTWPSAPLADNASNLPMWIYHDVDDIWVGVEDSRTAVRALRQRGAPTIYTETRGGGHSQELKDPSWNMEEWLLEQRRDPFPRTVYFTTHSPLRGRAYWLDVLALDDPNALAQLQARVEPAPSGPQLFLTLDNVRTLAVDLPQALFPPPAGLRIIAGAAPLEVAAPRPARIYLHRETPAAPYQVFTAPPSRDVPYRPYIAGGLQAMYVSGEPLMIVRPTGGRDAELLAAAREFGHRLATRNIGWWPFAMQPFFLGRIPVKDDVEVTAEDINRHNLIVVGPSTANRLLARLTNQLPAVEDSGTLRIGGESYDLRGRGYGLFHYNPEAPQRLLMVMASQEPGFYAVMNNGIAERMADERSLGLVITDVEPQRPVRHIAWDAAWQPSAGAFVDERLPEVFAAGDSAAIDVVAQAMRQATGADFAVTWETSALFQNAWPVPGAWDTASARWHDLRASMPPRPVILSGRASGQSLSRLLQPDPAARHQLAFRLFGDPALLQRAVADTGDAADYTICLDPKLVKNYHIATGANLVDGRAQRVDLFSALQRVVRRRSP